MSAATILASAIGAGYDKLSTRDLLLCILYGASAGSVSAIQSQTVALDNSTHLYSVAHGLSHVPLYLRAVLVCISDDAASGYSVGQELNIESLISSTATYHDTCAIFCDATNAYCSPPVEVFVGDEGFWLMVSGNGSAAMVSPTDFNNFQLKFYYA